MPEFHARHIEQYLSDMGTYLAAQQVPPIHIVLLGGSYMVLRVENRPSTQDIDFALVQPPGLSAPFLRYRAEETETRPPASQDAKALKDARFAVAKKYEMPRKMINDYASSFVRDMAPVLEATHWKTYGDGALCVYLPSDEYIFALKVMIARPKDKDDIEALMQRLSIQTEEETWAILRKFVKDEAYFIEYRVQDTLQSIFG